MKRILVIDESEVVRETLALILGREFAVSKRALGAQGFSFSGVQAEFDLLILGISPHYGLEAANLVRFAAQLPFAVLFLVDSRSTARSIQPEFQVDCLTKPFNPYDLHEKVGRLLARRTAVPRQVKSERDLRQITPYLEYPYLSRSAATLVGRFASARLPLLVSGEFGCGQDRVVSAVCHAQAMPGLRVWISATEVSSKYLADKELELSMQENVNGVTPTVVVHQLERASVSAQALLYNFLQQIEEKFSAPRYLATATGDLLEQVYRGEFLEALYYKIAMLTLKLLPLRERREDIPALAGWFARAYAQILGLPEPTIYADANRRLCNYLWFGNLHELESVIARTLALRRKAGIDADDLVFDFGAINLETEEGQNCSEFVSAYTPAEPEPAQFRPYNVGRPRSEGSNGHGRSLDLNVVIHELAHEFKNPMVTIKTFAQLLGDRYEDENFRTRFREVVGGDIERMDELLEMMIEFADFTAPSPSEVSLDEKLRAVAAELHSESAKRQTQFDWRGNGASHIIYADEAHLIYILKNVLLATLFQTKIGTDIQLDLVSQGGLIISHIREEASMASIGRYLEEGSASSAENILPLRVLLAKHLLEKNGGRFNLEAASGDRETFRMEFPIAEHGQKN